MELHNYISEKAPTSEDVYKVMVVDESNQLFSNMMHLLRVNLLIPPSTVSVERGYSVMNLLYSPIRSSLNEASLDRLMQICINCPKSLSDFHCDYLRYDFVVTASIQTYTRQQMYNFVDIFFVPSCRQSFNTDITFLPS